MASYVLVHGAFQGAWAWDSIRSPLERAGHRVDAVDLPSQGEDQTPLSEVTLDAYAGRVAAALDAHSQPVILCGHSLGGISISQAAEWRPEKVRKLVFIAAFLLPNGSSPKRFWQDLGVPSPVMASCTMSEDGVITYDTAHLAAQVLNCSPPEAIERSRTKTRPMARKPLGTPLVLSEANFGRIPRIYIETLQDHAIPLEYQRKMYAAMPCERVISLDTDHTPMASMPERLVEELLALAE